MAKSKIFFGDDENELRLSLVQAYRNKYFNLFMTRYKWNGLDKQQSNYIMRKFWSPEGTVAGFRIKGTEGLERMPEVALCFAPYAPMRYNVYDFPIGVNLINKRGVTFIPLGEQIVNQDVVLGFIQENHKGVFPMVDVYVQKIVEAEIAISMNVDAAKLPWIFACTPETEEKMRILFRDIQSGKKALFVSAEDVDKMKVLNPGATYIIDKLHEYAQAQETALREYLGFENVGVMEKKEHLITTELDANNEVTDQSADSFLVNLKEFAQGITDVLGVPVSVELNREEPEGNPDEMEREVQEDAEI